MNAVFRTGIVILLTASITAAGCTKKPAPKPVEVKTKMILSSTAFSDGARIPAKYTGSNASGGENLSIPLAWTQAPPGTKSFAVLMVDRYAQADNWIHWLVVDIPASIKSLPEGASKTLKLPEGVRELNNTYGQRGYYGPEPPPGSGDHEYEILVYALNVESLPINQSQTYNQFMEAIKGKILSTGRLSGLFAR